ncbi:hypothetical protein D3C72_1177610 [compost metagenome]
MVPMSRCSALMCSAISSPRRLTSLAAVASITSPTPMLMASTARLISPLASSMRDEVRM